VLSVLRSQATPWLPESWSSGDIYFYGDHSLSSPCLKTQLSNGPPNPGTHPAFTASDIAANSTLFSPGVVLLELGYDAPLQTPRRDERPQGRFEQPIGRFLHGAETREAGLEEAERDVWETRGEVPKL
jgi:hypothetical protein